MILCLVFYKITIHPYFDVVFNLNNFDASVAVVKLVCITRLSSDLFVSILQFNSTTANFTLEIK